MTNERAEREAVALLSSLGVTSPASLSLLDLRRSLPKAVLTETAERYAKETGAELLQDGIDGISLRLRGTTLILYRAKASAARRNFTIAHELGHLLLGHTSIDPVSEREADLFASALLLPACVVSRIEAVTGERLTTERMKRYTSGSAQFRTRRRAELDFADRIFSPEEREYAADFCAGMESAPAFSEIEDKWRDPQ